jgi:cytochrome c biogenesis protein CcdA
MGLLAFGAGMGVMYILAGLFFRTAINDSIGDDNEDSKMGLLESIFWPALISGGPKAQ